MKLVAFSAGRKYGNTEVFIKEALMAAEAKGIEVEFFRLNEFELHNCTACAGFCSRDVEKCPHQDDAAFLMDHFLDSDGVIIGAPVYSLTPGSLLFTFRDRIFGPKMDVADVWEMHNPEPAAAKGRFKARPGALISVGGALTEHWTSLGLPNLFTTTFSAQTEVVDHMNVFGVADPAEASIREEYLARARELGENLADAMLSHDHRWRGKQEGTCPCCHLNLLNVVPGTDKVICPVCGIEGKLSVEDGVIRTVFPITPANMKDNRLTVAGKKTHMLEIFEHVMQYIPRKEEAKEKLKKYIDYKDCEIKSPIREAKKAELREQFAKKDV